MGDVGVPVGQSWQSGGWRCWGQGETEYGVRWVEFRGGEHSRGWSLEIGWLDPSCESLWR